MEQELKQLFQRQSALSLRVKQEKTNLDYERSDVEALEDGTFKSFFYSAIGKKEEKLMQEDVHVPTLVHPRAYVSPRAKLGVGTMVLPLAVVNTGVTVENGCIVNIGALIDHDSVIGEGSHLAPGAIVKAENRIPTLVKIESGEVIENRAYPL